MKAKVILFVDYSFVSLFLLGETNNCFQSGTNWNATNKIYVRIFIHISYSTLHILKGF